MRKVLSHPLTMLFFGILATLFFLSLRTTQQNTTQKGNQVERNQTEVDLLKEKQTILRQQLEESQLPYNQEKVLRNELRQQKEGEVVIQVPSVAPRISPPPTPTPTITNWQAWIQVIFH